MDYSTYIASLEWAAKRREVIARDGGRCRLCASTSNLEVHHSSYNNFGHEESVDLITLCHDCHLVVTDMLRRRRYDKLEFGVGDILVISNQGKGCEDVTDFEVQDFGGDFANAQRPVGRPTEQVDERPEESLF